MWIYVSMEAIFIPTNACCLVQASCSPCMENKKKNKWILSDYIQEKMWGRVISPCQTTSSWKSIWVTEDICTWLTIDLELAEQISKNQFSYPLNPLNFSEIITIKGSEKVRICEAWRSLIIQEKGLQSCSWGAPKPGKALTPSSYPPSWLLSLHTSGIESRGHTGKTLKSCPGSPPGRV